MKFPREVGPPRKTIYNIQEYINFINKYNGMKKAIYASVYYFQKIYDNKKPDYSSAVIDKLYFDFDDKNCNAYEECKKLHEELKKENLKHTLIMSGRGYHLYIFCTPLVSQNPKSCIYNAQHHFIDKLNLKCDRQVIGNCAQLARVPNTYNIKAKKFCIPLTEEQFKSSDKIIKAVASQQNFIKNISIGTKLLDLNPFNYKSDRIEKLDFDLKLEDSASLNYLNNCDEKIKQLLLKKDLGWKERYIVILYFKEKGYIEKEVYNILKENLSERKFKHCVAEERQLQYLFERDDLMLPKSCGIKIYK